MTDYTNFVTTKLRAVPPVGITRQVDLIDGLFPHQIDLVRWALRRGRAAIFADTGLGKTPEARILAGTANALADIAETPAELERQRGAVIAGLQAIDRLMPKLHTFSLAAGSLELDNLLHSASGMGTADVRKALGMQA